MVATISIHSIQDIGRLLFGKKELGWSIIRVDIEMEWIIWCWKGRAWNFQVMYGRIEVILLQHFGKVNRCIWESVDYTREDVNEKEKNIRIKFDDDKVCWYEFNDLEQIDHSYCITIHKAQGSEFDVVIMIVPQAAPMLLTRNLLYTGLTRAKKLLIVIGNDRVVDFMINNVDSKKRNTGLEYKLKNT